MKDYSVTRMYSYRTNGGTYSDTALTGSLGHSGGGKGDLIHPVAFSYDKKTYRPPFGRNQGYGGPYNGAWIDGCLLFDGITRLTTFNTTSAEQAALYNQCISKLGDKIRGSLDLSVDLAEIGKTKQMIIQTAKFVTYVREFKREFRNLPLKALGKKWLEYKYGWLPTLQSIYELGKKVMSTNPDDHPLLMHERATHSESRSYDWWYAPSTTLFAVDQSVSTRVEVGICMSPHQSRLNSLAGYTSLNPVSIGWELMPYSFVVDWFIDVGGYLRNAENALIYQNRFMYGYISYSTKIAMQWRSKDFVMSGTNWRATGQSGGSGERVIFSRQVLGSYPFPRKPTLNPHLGSSRLLSAASLLSQFLGRR